MKIQRGFFLSAQALSLVVMTLVAYLPATQCGFIWDDDAYVTENPLLTAPDGLRRIWFSKDVPSQYFPMVYTTFRLEHSLWRLNPIGYHITNITLHILNALLLWYILRHLFVPGAWFAAAVFALHPVHVESVAWVTERKNVLMAIFFFVSLLAWSRFADKSQQSQRAWHFYVLSLLSYILALLSKTTACTLPAALVLILWVKHISLDARRWLQVVPYILLGVAMGVLTVWWEKYYQGTGLLGLEINPVERLLLASRALWFYLGKLIWPIRLAFSYPAWDIDAADSMQYVWLVVLLIAIANIWRWRDKLGRMGIAAIIFFVATLFPMLGFFELYTFRYTYVADHYQYLASIGPTTLIAAAGYRAATRLGKWARGLAVTLAVVVIATLGALTWQQTRAYKSPETIWQDVLKKNPDSWLAHNNLGLALQKDGKFGEAVRYYRFALQKKPNLPEAHYNLGSIFRSLGRPDEAFPHLYRALEIRPEYPEAHYNLAMLFHQQPDLDQAISHYRQAIHGNPNLAGAHNNLALAMAQKGEFEQAFKHFNDALRINPNLADVYYNMGVALKEQGKINEAIEKWKKTLQINPDHSGARRNLTLALKKNSEK